MPEIDWTCGPLPPLPDCLPQPERVALVWRKAYCLRAVEEPCVPHIRQQLRRRKRRRNWI